MNSAPQRMARNTGLITPFKAGFNSWLRGDGNPALVSFVTGAPGAGLKQGA